MKIDGRLLANEILGNLKKEIRTLQKQNITPHLAVVMIGTNQDSLSFIKQKQQAASKIGAQISLYHFKRTPLYQKIAQFILELSHNDTINGIIIQSPLPPSLSSQALIRRIKPEKDVDGFLAKSAFIPPLGKAIFKILNYIYFTRLLQTDKPETDFSKKLINWLKGQKIVLIGMGETGGKPIALTLRQNRINFMLLNHKSTTTKEYLNQANIIISAVGKPDIVTIQDISKGVILIGVGLYRQNNKLTGDYKEAEIANKAAFYTPTPGGVGPINVACLMENLITACHIQAKNM